MTIFVSNVGGGGGGPSSITINGDTGSISGSTFNIDGAAIGTSLTKTMETETSGLDTLLIANNTFYTPYVVDPSSTFGEKGTYTTIQSAIDAGFADSGNSNWFTVFVRDNQYTEDLTIDAFCFVQIVGFHSDGRLTPASPWLDGSITLGGSCKLDLYNFRIQSSGSGIGSAIGSQLTLTDCSISATTGTGVNLTSTSVNTFNAVNSYIDGITITSGSSTNFQSCGRLVNCVLTDVVTMDSTSRLKFTGCMIAGTSLTGTSAILAENCEFTATLAGTSTGTCELYNCVYRGTTPFINSSGTILYSNLTTVGNGVLLSSAGTFNLQSCTQGNVLQSRTVSSSASINFYDYYVGVTDTSSAWTMTLPSASVVPNQVFIIKDQSGGAATNNITITASSGNIDGAASHVINVNYGSFTVKSDGTNYFII